MLSPVIERARQRGTIGPSAPNKEALLNAMGTPGGMWGDAAGKLSVPGQAGGSVGSTPAEHRAIGTALGHDMSWMDKPGAVQTGAAPAAAPAPASPFQSGNRSVSGYLQEAIGSKLGDVRGIGDEAGRKKMAEDYIRTLVPEIEARGGKVGDIRNEKIQIDGQWRDLIQDIDGAANAQYIVPDEGGGPAMALGGGGINPALLAAQSGLAQLQGNPTQGINQALAQFAGRGPNIEALLAQLQQA